MSDPELIAGPAELPREREPKLFWNWTDVVLFAAGAPLALTAVAAVLMIAMKTLQWRVDSALPLLAMQSVLYVAAYGLLWLILMVRHSESVWTALRWAVRPRLGWRLFLVGFILAFAAALLGLALRAPKIDNPIMKLMSDPTSILVVVVFASTIGPAAEEAVFRGFLQPVATRTFGAVAGIAGTSLVFAALHGFEYHWCWQYLVIVFTASLAFGWTRLRWNSTGASTLLHAGYNLMFFMGYLFQGRNIATHG